MLFDGAWVAGSKTNLRFTGVQFTTLITANTSGESNVYIFLMRQNLLKTGSAWYGIELDRSMCASYLGALDTSCCTITKS